MRGSLSESSIRTGDRAHVRFRFMYRPEFLKPGARLIFREGRTKGIGKSDRAGLGIGKIETVQRFQRRTPGGISMCRHIPLRSAISPLSVTCAPSTSAVNSQ